MNKCYSVACIFKSEGSWSRILDRVMSGFEKAPSGVILWIEA